MGLLGRASTSLRLAVAATALLCVLCVAWRRWTILEVLEDHRYPYPYRPKASTTAHRSWDQALRLARDAVARLSTYEKATLASGVGWDRPGWNGMRARCVGSLTPIDSIGFPGLCLQDGPTGVRFGTNASAFPAPINIAATFDPSLMHARGVAMGSEWRAKGVHVSLQPVLNLMRTPNGGRGWEAFGADPYLQAVNARMNVEGVQSRGVQTTPKHFVLNEDEWFRNDVSTSVDVKTFHEVYLRPFKAAIDAGATAVMTSYNRIDNVFASENERTLSVLKNDLRFNGYVMTDWWGGHSTVKAALAGLDMQMPGSISWAEPTKSYFGQALISAVENGSVPMARLDDMATRVLAGWYKLRQDSGDHPQTSIDIWDIKKDGFVNVQGDHAALIREIAAASSILLKNDDAVLPIRRRKVKSIALIGFGAGPEEADLWTYLDNFNKGGDPHKTYDDSGDGNAPDHGSVITKGGIRGNIAQGWGSGTSWFPYLITPLAAIKERAKKKNIVVHHHLDNYDHAAAQKLAASVDVAIVFASADSGEGYVHYESNEPCPNGWMVGGNQGDRQNLSLWWGGDELITAVSEANKNTVVVIHGPGAVEMPWINRVKAAFLALFPGQESGNGIADVLFGDVNPSGRLPFTIAKDTKDYPVLSRPVTCADADITDYQQPYIEGRYFDYPFFDREGIHPLFAFGHGISYTEFRYSDLRIKVHPHGRYGDHHKVVVRFKLANTGRIDGHEVPQLYLSFPSIAAQPIRQLRGFDRVLLRAKQRKFVRFTLGFDELFYFDDVVGKAFVARGEYKVWVGASSRDLRLQGSFTLL